MYAGERWSTPKKCAKATAPRRQRAIPLADKQLNGLNEMLE